jgi:hypothetical protein
MSRSSTATKRVRRRQTHHLVGQRLEFGRAVRRRRQQHRDEAGGMPMPQQAKRHGQTVLVIVDDDHRAPAGVGRPRSRREPSPSLVEVFALTRGFVAQPVAGQVAGAVVRHDQAGLVDRADGGPGLARRTKSGDEDQVELTVERFGDRRRQPQSPWRHREDQGTLADQWAKPRGEPGRRTHARLRALGVRLPPICHGLSLPRLRGGVDAPTGGGRPPPSRGAARPGGAALPGGAMRPGPRGVAGSVRGGDLLEEEVTS